MKTIFYLTAVAVLCCVYPSNGFVVSPSSSSSSLSNLARVNNPVVSVNNKNKNNNYHSLIRFSGGAQSSKSTALNMAKKDEPAKKKKESAKKKTPAKTKKQAKDSSVNNKPSPILKVLNLIRNVIIFAFRTITIPFRMISAPFQRRWTDAGDIPSRFVGPNAPIVRGRAAKVTDGDTIRFLHKPSRWHPNELQKGEKLSDTCLPIRLCSIDTPETAKFGKPGQPFGEEAKQHLDKLLKDKLVMLKLLSKDQYGRAVAQIFVKSGLRRKYMDEEMLKAGLAEVYVGGGAVYGPLGKNKYLEIEAEAKKKKVGIWSQKNRESAAEFKKRTKE